jgi:predicted transcriptional regulator
MNNKNYTLLSSLLSSTSSSSYNYTYSEVSELREYTEELENKIVKQNYELKLIYGFIQGKIEKEELFKIKDLLDANDKTSAEIAETIINLNL